MFTFKNGKEIFRESVGDDVFSMLITGDCCPWGSSIETIRNGNANDIIAAVKPFIDSADLKIIQFEAPLTNNNTPKDKSGPNLKCPPECLDLVQFAGFDVALLANNHIGDHGGAVTMETIKRFNDVGIKTVGVGKNLADANLPLEIEYQGIKVAVLNFAENEFGAAKSNYPGYAPLDPLKNIKAIRAAKQIADLVFVVVHGGHERNPVPSPRMVETYRAFAEAGASMVMNIHTHCPEGIELWNGVPIVYSPGNLFFPWEDLTADHLNAMWWVGYMPKFYCDRNGVYALEIMPYHFDNKQIYAFTSKEKDEFFKYLSTLSELIIDFESRQNHFEAWTAHEGSCYLARLKDQLAKWPIELNSREAVRELLPVRNLFTCESHNDLVTQYLRLVEENRVNCAFEGWEKIAKLQRPEWAEKHWQKRLHN